MQESLTTSKSVLYSYNVKSKMAVSVLCAVTTLFLNAIEPLFLMFVVSFCYAILMKRNKILFVSYFFMIVMMALSLACIHFIALYVPSVKESAELSKVAIPFLRGASVMNVILPLTLTIRMQNLLSSLANMHLPFVIYLPGAVMIRFVPTFINDIKQLYECMKIRGFEFSFKNILFHPLLFIRMSFSPLVFMSLRSSEDLGIAAELKGIGQNRQCNLKKQSLHSKDYYLMLSSMFICFIAIYLQISSGNSFISTVGHR